eukprot:15311796-Heterocapsa_arctica.AAC.1
MNHEPGLLLSYLTLRMPEGRFEDLGQGDKEIVMEAIVKIQENIDKLKQQHSAKSEKIEERRGGKVSNAKRQELIAQRNECNDKIGALMKQKEGINECNDKIDALMKQKRAESPYMKGELQVKENLDTIKAEINAFRDDRRKIQEALSELMEDRKAE